MVGEDGRAGPVRTVAWTRPTLPFAVVGAVCVVAGGLVAAVTAHTPSEAAAWSAAYLVLVAGVAQIALGVGQAWLAPQPPSDRRVAVQFAGWNIGNAAVLVGTLLGIVRVVDVGGVLLVFSLALFALGVRGARRDWPLWAFRAIVVILLVSIPIGSVLARTHPG